MGGFEFDALYNNIPLWIYVLLEAQYLGSGVRLGPVGSRIVVEVLDCAVATEKEFRKRFDRETVGSDNDYGMNILTPGEFVMSDFFRVLNDHGCEIENVY